MPRKGLLDKAVPRLKRYMAEKGRPLTTREISEFLGVTFSSAGNVALYMEAVDIVQVVKRGGKNYYYLKGAFDESELAVMRPSPREREKPLSRPRRASARRLRRDTLKRRRTDSSLEEHLAAMRARASSGEGPSALSIIGLTEVSKPEEIVSAITIEHGSSETKPTLRTGEIFIKRELFGRVESIPKDFRLLTNEHTKYLKEHHLRGLDGYDEIERLNCFFAEESALERGEYGRVFYASKGTNPWERTYKVTVDSSRVEGGLKTERNQRNSDAGISSNTRVGSISC